MKQEDSVSQSQPSGAGDHSLAAGEAEPSAQWRPIESAPLDGAFLAIDSKWEIRRCWRHKPSSRTDDILTWARNSRFAATHWMPLPPPPMTEAA